MKLDLILIGLAGLNASRTPQATAPAGLRLPEIPLREIVELVRIDLPPDEMELLLERGVLPGCQLCPVRRSPAGDPIVMVDGSLLAIRREMARHLCVRRAEPDAA